jgi:membrane protease YdiL (CAAX protease family)
VATLVLVATVLFFEATFGLQTIAVLGFYNFSLKALICASIALLIYKIVRRVNKQEFPSLSLSWVSIRLFSLGCSVTMAVMLVVFGLILAVGGDADYSRFGMHVIPMSIVMFGIAVYEEILFRGILIMLALLWLRPAYAIIFTSIIFGILHAGDRGILGVMTQLMAAFVYAHLVISTNSL